MTGLELFAGAGGASEGLLAAGVELLACIEYDKDAHATALAAGHPSVLGDVREVTRTWDAEDKVDLLWASPPCQAFSSAGKRLGEADARNGWPWTLDAIDAVHPRWVLCENVPGLLHHNGGCKGRDGTTAGCAGCYWSGTVLPAFRARFPVVEVRTLDAADYGVPQRRKRVFLVGGPCAIRWPEPTHGPGRAPYVSIGEALGVRPGVVLDSGRNSSRNPTKEKPVTSADPAYCIGGRGNQILRMDPGARARVGGRQARTVSGCNPGVEKGGGMGYIENKKHPVNEWDKPGSTVSSGGGGHCAAPYYVRTECLGASSSSSSEPAPTIGTKVNTYLHTTDPGTRRVGDILNRPAPCLTVGDHASSRNVISASAKTRSEYDRAGIQRLTVRQCATLQGFPPDYPWQGNQTEQYRQVGNACVPRVVELLVREVIKADAETPSSLQVNQDQRQKVPATQVHHDVPSRTGAGPR